MATEELFELVEQPACEGLEEELDKWRHEHFHGKRDNHFSGEYLERTSQLDLARHFAQWDRMQIVEVFVIERMVMPGVWELFSDTFFIDEKIALEECLGAMQNLMKMKKDFTLKVTKLSNSTPNRPNNKKG